MRYRSLLLLSLLASSAHALDLSPYTYVGTASGGIAWEGAGETQTLEVVPGLASRYKSNRETRMPGVGEIFVGGQYQSDKDWDAQFGIAYGMVSTTTMEGHIYNGGNDGLYNYRLQQSRLAAKAKILGDVGTMLQNWVSFSMGATFYKAYDFDNTSLTTTMPNFDDNTGTAFSFSAGIGMQYIISPNWQIGLGYEFTDWGTTYLGKAPGQVTDKQLEVDNFYTNGLIITLSFVG